MNMAGPEIVEQARRRQRGRNLALLGVLGGLVVIFYLLTFVIMGSVGS